MTSSESEIQVGLVLALVCCAYSCLTGHHAVYSVGKEIIRANEPAGPQNFGQTQVRIRYQFNAPNIGM